MPGEITEKEIEATCLSFQSSYTLSDGVICIWKQCSNFCIQYQFKISGNVLGTSAYNHTDFGENLNNRKWEMEILIPD